MKDECLTLSDGRVLAYRMGQYIAKNIPNCKATFCEGEAYMLLVPHWEKILTVLLAL